MTTDRPESGVRARSGLPTPVGRIAGSRCPVRKNQADSQGTMKRSNITTQPRDKRASNAPAPQDRVDTSNEALGVINAGSQHEGAVNSTATQTSALVNQEVQTAEMSDVVKRETHTSTQGGILTGPHDESSNHEDSQSKRFNSTNDEMRSNASSNGGEMSGLQSIPQSRTDIPPLSPCITRPLSTTAPEFGPVLRVSASAERIIMGVGVSNDNRRSNAGRRILVPTTKDIQKARRDHARAAVLNEDRSFPFASNGLTTHHESRIPTSEGRKMRAVSDEMQSSLLNKRPDQNLRTVKAISDLGRVQTLSTDEDPFFDAQSTLEGTQTMHSHRESSQLQQPPVPTAIELPVTISNEQIEDYSTRANGTASREAEETASDFETPDHSDQDPTITQPESFPPRSSSRTPALRFTNNHSTAEPLTSEPVLGRESSSAFVVSQNNVGNETGRERKRGSLPHPSTKSRVLSGVRVLFHKGKKTSVAENGSPMPPVPEARLAHCPTVASKNRRGANVRASVAAPIAISAPVIATSVPEVAQPQPGHGNAEIDNAATLVRQVLHMAHVAPPGPDKDRLLAMGRTMFGAFTLACNADMAREAASQSTRRAEIAYAQCMQSIVEIADYVRSATQG